MSCKFVVALFLTVLVTVCTGENWCNVQSCKTYKKGTHTLCAFPQSGPAAACKKEDGLGGGISDSDRQTILSLHNQERQKVASGGETRGSNGPQPRAKPGAIPNLQWDDKLAKIAQRWADQCDYGHDKCRDTDEYQVGQSIATKGTSGSITAIPIADLVNMWINEVNYFDKNEVPKFSGNLKAKNGKDIGHYTQVIWAETTKIGCGLRNYKNGGFNNRYLVCNYGPSGNFPGHAIYKT